MFLNYLSQKEKEIFWNIANMVVRVDGELAQEEMDMLEEYKREMQSDFCFDETKVDKLAILDELKDSSMQVKKIIYLELYGLVYADKKYTIEERTFMSKIQENFDIADTDIKALEDCVIEIMGIYRRLGEIIGAV